MTAEPPAGSASPAGRGQVPPPRAAGRVVRPRVPTVRATARPVPGPVIRAAAPDRWRVRASARVRPSLVLDPATPLRLIPEALGSPAVGGVPGRLVGGTGPEPTPDAAPAADAAGRLGADAEVAPQHQESVRPAAVAVPKRGLLGRWVLPVSVATAAALVAGTGYLAVTQPRGDADMGRWGAAAEQAQRPGPRPAEDIARRPAQLPSGWAAATANPDPFGTATVAAQGVPTRLRITAIGVDAALESLHLAGDGSLAPPTDFAEAGWYADGTAPGDQGPAIVAGHVDSKRGPAVFYRLREMEVGDRIEVIRGGEIVRFRVVSAAWYPKTTFPTQQVYGPTPDRQLRLITCGGVFDHRLRSYKDNLVVYAVAG